MTDWDGLVVVVAATLWGPLRWSERHVAEHLNTHVPVLYVDPPLPRRAGRRDTALADVFDEPPLRVLGPGLARLTPRVPPGKRHPGLRQLADLLTRRALRSAIAELGSPRVRAVIAVPERPVFGTCGEDLRVHWAKDDYAAAARLIGHPAGRLRRGDARMARDADVVMVASPALADKWRDLGARRVVLLPPGCDSRLGDAVDTASPADDVPTGGPVLGVIGTMSDRLDLDCLTAVADRGHALVLVGPRGRFSDPARFDRFVGRDNVHALGPRPFDDLPRYHAAIDVGLVPYADTAFNRASFPLKTLEYLAAGRPVVATDLPAVQWLDTDLVARAFTPTAFADAAVEAIASARDPERVAARRRVAARHGWDARVRDLVAALGLTGPAEAGDAVVHGGQSPSSG